MLGSYDDTGAFFRFLFSRVVSILFSFVFVSFMSIFCIDCGVRVLLHSIQYQIRML